MFSHKVPYILKPDDILFFLHIPKTAGTTLISLLDQHFLPDEICPEQLDTQVKNLSPNDIAKYRFFRGHLDYDLYKLLPRKPLYITMLRHPLRRVISLYEFWKRNSEAWVDNYSIYNDIFREAVNLDLFDFVRSSNDLVRLEVENNQARRIVANARDPLENFTDQEILEIAKRRIAEEFLFFGLVEKFDESLQLLYYSLGWFPTNSYQKMMVASKQFNNDSLPSETRDAILERNRIDIALYEFAWNLFLERYQEMIHQLIEQSYLDHFHEWNFPKSQLKILIDQPISGMGWYSPEIASDGKTFRWMGPDKESFFDVSLPRNSDLSITIEIIHSIDASILLDFKCFANGMEIPLTKISGDEYRGIFQGVITQRMLGLNPSLTRLMFRVNRTISPQELDPNSPDTRQLSLAVHSVTVETDTSTVQVTEKLEGLDLKKRRLLDHDLIIKERDRLRSEIDHANKELDALRSELDWARTDLKYLRNDIVEIRDERDELQSQVRRMKEELLTIHALQSDLERVRGELGKVQAELVTKSDEAENYKKEYVSLLYSRSYRITAPLRSLFLLVQKLKNRCRKLASSNDTKARSLSLPEPANSLEDIMEDEKYYINFFLREVSILRKQKFEDER